MLFMNSFQKSTLVLVAVFVLSSCAAPLKTDTITFKLPSSYPNFQSIKGLDIAIQPISSKQKSEEIFGTDLKTANILPVHIIVQNNGTHEFEIGSSQIFGKTANGEYTVAYNLNKAAEHVRGSSIGTTAVTSAIVGGVAGAAAGAAVGAGVGHASGDTSTGAESGAIIGGSVGATSGAAAGLSDSFTLQFKKELANLAFGNQVVFPGDIKQGFIFLKWNNYTKIRMKIFDITTNETDVKEFGISVSR